MSLGIRGAPFKVVAECPIIVRHVPATHTIYARNRSTAGRDFDFSSMSHPSGLRWVTSDAMADAVVEAVADCEAGILQGRL